MRASLGGAIERFDTLREGQTGWDVVGRPGGPRSCREPHEGAEHASPTG